jgi:hypothetical protein
LRQPDWGINYVPFFSQVNVTKSDELFFLDQLQQNQFVIHSSRCTFDGSKKTDDKIVELWIVAKKSRVVIKYSNDLHTIVNFSLNRSSLYFSNQIIQNSAFEDKNRIHLGKKDQKPTVIFHIKAKESIIDIVEG